MKKVFKLLVLATIFTFVNTGVSFAEITKNFYGYQVKDVNIRQLTNEIDTAIEAYKGDDKFKPLSNVSNAYIYSDKNSTYFVRLYPANKNTDIYVVSNEKYNVENNEMTDLLKQSKHRFDKLTDKDALKEYQFDFYKSD